MEAVRATVYFDTENWQKFRVACVQRKTSASEVLRTFVAQQLEAWRKEETTKKEQDNC
jgi:hypothetical protein